MGFFSRYRNRQHKTPNRYSFSLVSAYPTPKSTVSRKLHGPERPFKFRSLSNKDKLQHTLFITKTKMGNCLGGFTELFKRYDDCKNDALENLDHYHQVGEKEFINVDGDEIMRDVSDDSSIEEVDVSVYGNKNKDLVMLDDEKEDFVVVPVYKKLYQSANKRDCKISGIKSDIEEKEKCLQGLRYRPKGKKDLVKECFTPLTEEDESVVADAFSNRNKGVVVVSHESSNIDITGEKLRCLRNGGWLNDEVVNVYVALLKEREKREPEKFLKCHFFNTFFYKKVIGRGGYSFESVKRWTTQKKLGYSLLECDKIFVPIHRQAHWCLAVINKKEKKIQYLDSFKGEDSRVLDVMAKYYIDEVKDKSGKEIDISSWDLENVMDLPEQMNGYDCGMFMIKYADFYSRDLGLCFSQEDMPYFRKRTAKELLRLKAD